MRTLQLICSSSGTNQLTAGDFMKITSNKNRHLASTAVAALVLTPVAGKFQPCPCPCLLPLGYSLADCLALLVSQAVSDNISRQEKNHEY